jgi:hypothetical protein
VATRQWIGTSSTAVDWSLIREKASFCLGATVLMLLFGRQGWLVWQQWRLLRAWLAPSWARILRRWQGRVPLCHGLLYHEAQPFEILVTHR